MKIYVIDGKKYVNSKDMAAEKGISYENVQYHIRARHFKSIKYRDILFIEYESFLEYERERKAKTKKEK